MCLLILCISGGAYSLKAIRNDRFLFTFRIKLRSSQQRNIFSYFILLVMSDVVLESTSNKITYYGDLKKKFKGIKSRNVGA